MTSFTSSLSGMFRKSTRDLHGLLKEYPTDASAYELLEDCGKGVSATVYRARCKPLDEIVAVKKMNLESVHSNLDEIVHEAQLMRNYHHPNVLPLYTAFVDGSDLWMVLPFISGGSVLHIMKYAYPEGLEEVVIATIMRDVLKALDYVHRQGGIHRDIKAGNILVDKDGSVKLADFGVATSMDRSGSWGHEKGTRMTFVGTPCWMAPEVMEQTAGYDNAADIWSFGIAMLEMAHGHAPFAKYPPMKVLLMTLQNPPPSLEDKGKKHFSKAMRDVVTRCLQKDPRSRPAAAHLLEHKFFKQARDEEYLAKHLMAGLPSLGDRVQEIRQGKAATRGADNERNFARSQEEYKKGVSSWNFDVAALKAQADLEGDDNEPMMLPTIREDEPHGVGDDDRSSVAAVTLSGAVATGMAAAVGAAAAGVAVAVAAGTTEGLVSPAVSAGPTSVSSPTESGALPPRTSGSGSTTASSFATAVENGLAAVADQQPLLQQPSGAGGAGGASSAGERSLATDSWGIWTSSPDVGGSREASQTTTASAGLPSKSAKTKGRFSVYSESDPVPPMSPSSPPQLPPMPDHAAVTGIVPTVPSVSVTGTLAPASSTASQPPSESSPPILSPSASAAVREPDTQAHAVPSSRRSDDGAKRDEVGKAAASGDGGGGGGGGGGSVAPSVASSAAPSVDGDAVAKDAKPKTKGRFTVIENNPVTGPTPVVVSTLERKPSVAALDGHGARAGAGEAAAAAAAAGSGGGGSRSTGGGASTSSSSAPLAALLPRLQELLDHAAQQQHALNRLLAAVQETEGAGPGKPAAALLQPGRTLFEAGALHAPGDVELLEELRGTVRGLQARLLDAEAENARLRLRNSALEAAHGRGSRRDGSESGWGAGGPLATTPSPPHLSPRTARSPRASDDGHAVAGH